MNHSRTTHHGFDSSRSSRRSIDELLIGWLHSCQNSRKPCASLPSADITGLPTNKNCVCLDSFTSAPDGASDPARQVARSSAPGKSPTFIRDAQGIWSMRSPALARPMASRSAAGEPILSGVLRTNRCTASYVNTASWLPSRLTSAPDLCPDGKQPSSFSGWSPCRHGIQTVEPGIGIAAVFGQQVQRRPPRKWLRSRNSSSPAES